jgi:DNA-binding PadR family transcriptional regulator
MSSIRLFILGTLDERGAMHGHHLRLLAEEEHVHKWTDVTVGALYGAIKRLASDGLIAETRVEREGSYPERQVFDITTEGRAALAELRLSGLSDVVVRPDPFDLAMTRLDRDRLHELAAVIEQRVATLEQLLAASEADLVRIRSFLTVGERVVMTHKSSRLRADIAWHKNLLTELPLIIADESARTKAS